MSRPVPHPDQNPVEQLGALAVQQPLHSRPSEELAQCASELSPLPRFGPGLNVPIPFVMASILLEEGSVNGFVGSRSDQPFLPGLIHDRDYATVVIDQPFGEGLLKG